jgi:hypothetical protein
MLAVHILTDSKPSTSCLGGEGGRKEGEDEGLRSSGNENGKYKVQITITKAYFVKLFPAAIAFVVT